MSHRHLVAVVCVLYATGVARAQNAVSTLAGTTGTSGFVNGTGSAAQFRFTNPSGAAVDSAGNVFVADALNNVIRKITPAGVVSTFAGSTSGTAGNGDGTGTTAYFSSPLGLTIDGADNLYVADSGNHAIRMVTTAGVVTTLAGTAGGANTSVAVANGYLDGTGNGARFSTPIGIAADRGGSGGAAVNVYVADTQNNAVRQIVVSSKVVTTLAGGGPTAPGFVDATNLTARFSHPDGIVSDAAGSTLYVADTNNNRIRKIVITAGPNATVSTLAGSGSAGYAEGTGTAASFNLPTEVTLDGSGNILISDTLDQVVRSITPAGVTSLVAGIPNSAGSSNGLALSAARFSVPSGLAVSGTTVFVVDTNNQVVRTIAPANAPSISSNPANLTVTVGNNAIFSVTATGNPTVAYQWQQSTDSGGTWAALVNGLNGIAGAQTSQLTIANVGASMTGSQFRAVVSNGVTPPAISTAAVLTVNQTPSITNATTTFYVTVNTPIAGAAITSTGSPAPTLSYTGSFPPWAALNTSTGEITGTPTDVGTSPYTFSVTATNTAGTSSAVPFTIVVQTGPAITAQPSNQSVTVGNSAVFSVAASSTPTVSGYQWQRSTNSGGSWFNLSDTGAYSGSSSPSLTVANTTTSMNGDQFRVIVTNTIGTSTSNAATLTVRQVPLITSIASATFVVNQAGSFTLQATGFPAPTFGYSGSFPSWAQLNTSTGVISGTATDVSGSPYTFVLTATNAAGTASQNFTLTVSPTSLTPSIVTQPQNQTIGITQNAAFTVVATGNPDPTYQWERFRSGDADYVNLTDAGQYSGTTTATLTITGVTAEMNGDQYRVVVTNSLGAATSNSAQLTVTASGVFSTVAGQAGVRGIANGSGASAQFNAPTAIAVDASGNMYVADAANHVIRRVTSAGVVTTLAGTPGSPGSTDGFGSAARFNTPSGIAIDGSGTIYVADAGNHTIRAVSLGGAVTTVAGAPGLLGNIDGPGSSARFAFPSGVAVDSSGNVYVADSSNNKIRKIIPGTGTYDVSTITLLDGSGNPVLLQLPNAVAVDASFNVYVADSRNHVIRRIAFGGVTTTMAGLVGTAGSADGTGSAARFRQPDGVAVDSSGNVYVADTLNHTVREISSSGAVSTIAGLAGISGSADGGGSTARFNQPYGVAVDSGGTVYIADTFNHTIRRSGQGTAPVITTDVQSRAVTVGSAVTFSVGASGVPAPSFQWQRQAAGTSGFINLVNNTIYSGVNTATVTISNTTDAMNGDRFRVVVNNLVAPSATSAAGTLLVQPAGSGPVIQTQPASTSANRGGTATLTVAATGTGALSYVWWKDGLPVTGGTGATLTIANVQPADAGSYTVVVSNAFGSATSNPADVTVNSAPVITTMQHAPIGLAGASLTLMSNVAAGDGVTFQWFKNGTAIAGATGSTYTLSDMQFGNAGLYNVVVTNSVGSTTGPLVPVTVAASVSNPIITGQPASRIVLSGSSISLSVDAASAGPLTYQWQKNGSAIDGATTTTLTFANVQASDAADYSVVVSNAVGSVTSNSATVHVTGHSYAGVYFGSFAEGVGTFAMYVRPDNTGVFAGVIAGSSAPLVTLNLAINDSGQFLFTQPATASQSSASALSLDVPVRAAALGATTVGGSISSAGTVFGQLSGGATVAFTATRASDDGATKALAGYYLAGSVNGAGHTLTIVSANGQAFALAQVGAAADGGMGAMSTNGTLAVNTGRTTILEVITTSTGTLSGSSAGAVTGSYSGGSDASLANQRLANISTRAQVGSGASVEIAGFVIGGTTSKTVLIRAIGPTLGGFGISNALSAPKLELYHGTALVASNTGVSNSPDAAAIAAAGAAVGAFSPIPNPADSALLITLPPGNYTAQVSSADGKSGIALAEVYDLSPIEAGQKLKNISTRASVGSGDSTLIAGVVVTGSAPKRVLIRAVGPGLATYNVSGVLAQPVLSLKTLAGQTLAENTGWTTSSDAAAISVAGQEVGGFPLVTGDSAMIVTLPPGSYSAQVTGVGGTTGIALVEVYELQ